MIEIAEEIGSPPTVRWGVRNMVWSSLLPQGEYEAGLAFLETWLARVRRAQDAVLVAQFQVDKAYLLLLLGQFEPALEVTQKILRDADRLLDYSDQIFIWRIVGYCQIGLGRFRQARESFQVGLELAAKAGETVDAGGWLLHLAYVAHLEGDGARLRAIMEQVKRGDVSLLVAFGFFDREAARLYLALGEVEQALESSSKAARAVEMLGQAMGWEQSCLLTHARVLRAVGRDDEADDYLRRAYERVMLVARKTQDEGLRQSWLEDMPDNREIIAEWEERGKPAS
jgi:tetratricopeptide (TPR) repeat protein